MRTQLFAEADPQAVAPASPAQWRFATSWARSLEEVREAQRLRYRVFAGEIGARLQLPPGLPAGHDADFFDDFCDHLLVHVEHADGSEPPTLVGTYRLLSPGAARRAGGCYIESEFDIAPLAGMRSSAVELGRACIDARWRSGGVILALWSELGRYMVQHRLDSMFGCASISLAGGPQLAQRIWQQLQRSHLVEPGLRIRPHKALPALAEPAAEEVALREIPPLLKGYLRCGARVLGAPAIDTDFNAADLPIVVRVKDMPPRYVRQFLTPG